MSLIAPRALRCSRGSFLFAPAYRKKNLGFLEGKTGGSVILLLEASLQLFIGNWVNHLRIFAAGAGEGGSTVHVAGFPKKDRSLR